MNPFKTLGLQPHAIKGLHDKEVYDIVKSLYKALMLVHHPDRGGSEAKSRMLNQAMDELDLEQYPQQFAEWRKQFLKPRKEQLEEREGKRDQMLRASLYRSANLEHALISSLGERWFPPSPPAEMTYNLAPVPVTHLNGKLLVTKAVEHFILDRVISRNRDVGQSIWTPTTPANGFTEMTVDGEGLLHFRQATRYEVPIGQKKSAPQGLRWTHTQHSNFIYWILGAEERTDPTVKIIGGIDPRSPRIKEDQQNHLDIFRTLLPDSMEEKQLLKKAGDGFTLEAFRPFLPFLRPEIRQTDLVIGLRHFTDKGQSRFLIFGSALSWKKE